MMVKVPFKGVRLLVGDGLGKRVKIPHGPAHCERRRNPIRIGEQSELNPAGIGEQSEPNPIRIGEQSEPNPIRIGEQSEPNPFYTTVSASGGHGKVGRLG